MVKLITLLSFCLILSFSTTLAQRQRRKRRGEERDVTPDEVAEITDDVEIKDDTEDLAKK